MPGFGLLSFYDNLKFRNGWIPGYRKCIVALFIGIWALMAVNAFAQATGDDEIPMRAKRETLGIHFDGVDLAENTQIRQAIVKKLAYRFDPIPDTGTYNIYIKVTEIIKDNYCLRVTVEFPSGKNKKFPDCFDLTLPTSNVAKKINGMVIEIQDGIQESSPLSSRIIEVDGGTVYVDMGSEVGILLGDKLEVFNTDGRKVGLLKVLAVNEREAQAKIIRGGNMMPGFSVSPRSNLLGGAGLEYTYFTVNDDEGDHQGRRVMFVAWGGSRNGWFSAQFGTGYMDVWHERGMHVIDLDLMASIEILTDRFFIDIGGGGGLSAYREYEGGKTDSTSPKIKWYGSYKGFGGVRLHPTRNFSLSFRLEHLDYGKFEGPEQPAIRLGFMYYFRVKQLNRSAGQ